MTETSAYAMNTQFVKDSDNFRALTDTQLCGVFAPLEFSRSNFFGLELSRINLRSKQILIYIYISTDDFFEKVIISAIHLIWILRLKFYSVQSKYVRFIKI